MKPLILPALLVALALGLGPAAPVQAAAASGAAGTTARPHAAALTNATADATNAPQAWAVVPASSEGPDGRGSIEHVVEPGDTYEDRVAVRNLGATALTVELSVHGAAQTTDNDFELATESDPTSHLATWATLDSDRVSVEPGGATVVPVRFEVPAGAEPGDHAGGIVALAVGDDEADVHYQVGTRVHLRVAGPIEPGLRIDNAHASVPWTLLPFARLEAAASATVVNTGNMRLTPGVRVEARTLFGLWRTSFGVAEVGELLPDGARSVAGALAGVPQLGPVWVTFSVPEAASIGQDVTGMLSVESVTVVVWAVPWTLIGVALIIGAAGVVAVRNLRLRRALVVGAADGPEGSAVDA